MVKRFFVLILLIILVSCGKSEKTSNLSASSGAIKPVDIESLLKKPAYGDSIVTPLADDIFTLNFLTYRNANEGEIIYLISDSLVSYNNKLEVVPRLARNWKVNKDHTSIVFHLRRGVKFSDGVEFTSKDVKFTYDCIFDPANDLEDIAKIMNNLKKVRIIDKYTVEFLFKKPEPFIMDYFIDYYILPEHIYNTKKYTLKNNPANKMPVGTGPFKLVKWIKDREIVLEANKDYFLGRPYLDRIVYLKSGSMSVDFERLKKGEFDILPIDTTIYKFKTGLPEIEKNFDKYRYYVLAFYYIAWNVHKKPMKDRNVRLAIAYLSDLQRFNRLAFFGLFKVAVSPIHPQSKFFNKNLTPFPFDLKKARQLLNGAGYMDSNGDGYLEDKDGKPLTIRLLTRSGLSIYNRVPVFLQENCKKAGVKLIIDCEEPGVFNKKMASLDYDGVLFGWMIYPSPSYLVNMFSKPSKNGYSMNMNRYYNSEIDGLIKKLNTTFDPEVRLNICFRIQDILYREQPYLFLFYPSALVLAHKRYRNLKPSPLGMFKWYPGIARVYVPLPLQKKN